MKTVKATNQQVQRKRLWPKDEQTLSDLAHLRERIKLLYEEVDELEEELREKLTPGIHYVTSSGVVYSLRDNFAQGNLHHISVYAKQLELVEVKVKE